MDEKQTKMGKPRVEAPWVEKMSNSRGRLYYFNTSTGESTWVMPKSMAQANDNKSRAKQESATGLNSGSVAIQKMRAHAQGQVDAPKDDGKLKKMSEKLTSSDKSYKMERAEGANIRADNNNQSKFVDVNGGKISGRSLPRPPAPSSKTVSQKESLSSRDSNAKKEYKGQSSANESVSRTSSKKNANSANAKQSDDKNARSGKSNTQQTKTERSKESSRAKKIKSIFDLVPTISRDAKRSVSDRLTKHTKKHDTKGDNGLSSLKKAVISEQLRTVSPSKKPTSIHDLVPVTQGSVTARLNQKANDNARASHSTGSGIVDVPFTISKKSTSSIHELVQPNKRSASNTLNEKTSESNGRNKVGSRWSQKPTSIHDLAVPVTGVSLSDRLKAKANEENFTGIASKPFYGSISYSAYETTSRDIDDSSAVPMEDVEMMDETQMLSGSAIEAMKYDLNAENEMEWETTPEEVITNIITSIRSIGDSVPESVHFTSSSPVPMASWTNKVVVVVDTNIFLSKMPYIHELIGQDVKVDVVILIPYMVIQELDKIKHRSERSVSIMAGRAIRFINDALKSKNPKIQVQGALQHKQHLIEIDSPDDKILNCCLQVKAYLDRTLLVTNDINLSNKGIATGIECHTVKSLFEILPHTS